jgi:hypothetical protein
VVTNQHLIMDNKGLLVVFPKYEDGKVVTERNVYMEALRTGQGVDSTLFAEDKVHDLAILQVETIPADVPALKLVKDSPAPGDKVHSIGSPGNMGPVFAYAEGSVKQQVNLNWRFLMGVGKLPLTFTAKVLELSAAVNSGDMGGPLLSEKGNLAGIASGVTAGNGGTCYIDVSEIRALLQSKMIDPQVAADDPGAPKSEAVAKMDPKKDPKAKDPKGKNNPKAKADAQAKPTDPAKREAEASLKLDQAKKAEAGKALELLRDVVKNYPETRAAEEAKPLLDKAEAEKRETDAYIKLDLARDLEKSGNPAKAQQRYREIVKEYPGTKAADEAQKLIDKK